MKRPLWTRDIVPLSMLAVMSAQQPGRRVPYARHWSAEAMTFIWFPVQAPFWRVSPLMEHRNTAHR